MSIAPIEKRLDQMAGLEETATTTDLVGDPLPPPIDMPPSPEPAFEPVQVAGKRAIIGKIVGAFSEEAGKVTTAPIERIGKPSGDMPAVPAPPGGDAVPRANAAELNAITGQQPVRVVGDKVITEPISREEFMRFVEVRQDAATFGAPPRVRPNLNLINSEDSIKKTLAGMVEYNKNWVDQQRRAGRKFDDILADSEKIPADQILKLSLNRKPGDRPFTDAESVALRKTQIDLAVETDAAVDRALRSGSPEDLANAGMLIQIQGYSEAAYLGNVADYGRGLAVNRLMMAPDKARSDAMRQIIEQTGIKAPVDQTSAPGMETVADLAGVRGAPDNATIAPQLSEAEKMVDAMGGKDNLRLAIQAYKALPSTAQRQAFTRRLLSLGRAGMDSVAEIYQSALVSGVQTHFYNFLGTPIHTSLMLTERYLAAMLRGDDAAKSAVLHGIRVIPKYLNQAMAAGWDAFKTEMPSDVASKFDQSRIATKAENFGVVPETMLGKTIDAIGVGTRFMGFRVLTTVDETYKSLLRGMEMEMIAAEASGKAFNSALDSGKTVEQATNVARDVFMRTVDADSTFANASEFARIATFQDDLPGAFLGEAQKVFAHPLAKLLGFPFFKTPAQIALRIQERTPLAVVMPRFWKAIVNPSTEAERSVAIAKVGFASAFGSSIMAANYISGGNIEITGYGPTNPKERANWLQTHQPYSIGVKSEDGTIRWVDYGRYDPVSGVLGMWADIRDTVIHMNDPDKEESVILDGAMSTVNYMLESQPMVQFAAELASIIRPQSDEERIDSASQFERIIGALQKQVTASGLVVGQSLVTGGMAPSGFVANIERYIDPFKRSTLPENQYDYFDIPGFRMTMRPVYEAIQQHRSRLPYFSNQMFVQRNDWYEPIKQGFGDLTTFLPTKIQDKRYNAINRELESLRSGFPRISDTMGESMIKLNDQQFERYKELVNYPARSAFALQMLGGYSPEQVRDMTAAQREKATKEVSESIPSLADHLISVINLPEYKTTIDAETGVERPTTKGERMSILTNARQTYTQIAKRLMLAEFADLQSLVDQRKAYEDKMARKPPSLPLSPDVQKSLNIKMETGPGAQ